MSIRWAVAALLCAGIGEAAEPADYFPLQVGNHWVLQTSGSNPEILNIRVLRTRVLNNNTYFLVSGYAPSDVWMRQGADATLYAFDTASNAETVLAKLAPGAPRYRTSLSGCEQTALSSFPTGAVYQGPNFTLPGALALSYTPEGCRDIGITQEGYAAGVGLVHRSITTFRGPVVYDLVYARVNGAPLIGKSGEIVLHYDFSRGSEGWLAGFTDYSLKTGDLQFLAELRPLPDEIDPSRNAFYVQSMNRSDDVFMFLKKAIGSEEGLAPNQSYRVAFDLRFASNAASGCMGVGGAPGESVYLKAGAALDEPLATLGPNGEIHLSADKGQQSSGGRDAAVAGHIANGRPCGGAAASYVGVARQLAWPTSIRTDDRGSMWLLAGTDSGYEGLTGLYYQSITVRINTDVKPVLARRRR